jgi:thiol-disulfide isomerase/thioredoxin
VLFVAASVAAVASGQQANPPAGQVATNPAPAPAAGGAPAAAPRVAPPPDQAAFTAATAIKDPAEKLAALRKFKTDFPSSPGVTQADSAIFDTLVTSFPERTDEVLKALNIVVGNIPTGATGQGRLLQIAALAVRLADKKILLDKAEGLVNEALEYLDTDTKATFKKAQAQGIETLGVVHIAKGDTNRAEKELKDAYAANPTLTRAPIELARMELKRGNDKAALAYFMPLAAIGSLKGDDDVAFKAAYTKVHGNLSGLDAEVDKAYREKFPNPVKVESYKKTPARTTRVVLAEMFTGSGCPPCVSADLALDAVGERYAGSEVITLAYHANIPRPDPMVVAGGDVRRNYYRVTGVPTIEVDGSGKVGGGAREAAPRTYADYVTMIDKALETAPRANVTARATTDGSKVKVTATVSNVAADAKDVKLQIVIAEHELRFVGENGIRFHSMVVRGVAGENNGGFAVNATGDTTVEWTFDLAAIREDVTKTIATEIARVHARDTTPVAYNAENKAMVNIDTAALSVVAFVQEGLPIPAATPGVAAPPAPDRKILQAVRVDVSKGGGPEQK